MVGLSAEEQFRRRARKALAAGEPFEARGEVNKRLLEEVRAEVEQGKASVRDQTSKGVKRIRQVSRSIRNAHAVAKEKKAMAIVKATCVADDCRQSISRVTKNCAAGTA